MFFDDSAADPQSQTGALGLFGCEERLKQTLGSFSTDTATVVGDTDDKPRKMSLFFECVPYSNTKSSAVWHGLNRIGNQIHESLFQFTWKTVRLSSGFVDGL